MLALLTFIVDHPLPLFVRPSLPVLAKSFKRAILAPSSATLLFWWRTMSTSSCKSAGRGRGAGSGEGEWCWRWAAGPLTQRIPPHPSVFVTHAAARPSTAKLVRARWRTLWRHSYTHPLGSTRACCRTPKAQRQRTTHSSRNGYHQGRKKNSCLTP